MRLKVLALVACLFLVNTACSEVGPEATNPLAPTAQSQEAKPSKPSTTQIAATVTFSDRDGDAIRSDGGGTYVNGGRLEVVLYTQSKDLVMRGGGRALSLSHTNRLSGTGPVGTTVVNDIFMNIHGILDMVPGGPSLIKGATFRRTPKESFRFNPTYDLGATKVNVVRNTAQTWTVTADDPSTGRAVLWNRTALGVYAMPFQLTVVCPSCS